MGRRAGRSGAGSGLRLPAAVMRHGKTRHRRRLRLLQRREGFPGAARAGAARRGDTRQVLQFVKTGAARCDFGGDMAVTDAAADANNHDRILMRVILIRKQELVAEINGRNQWVPPLDPGGSR